MTTLAGPIPSHVAAPRKPAWSAVDTITVVALSALGGVLRLVHITTPHGFVFDEFYASDACFYLRGPGGHCLTDGEISAVHPPLAKWLMAVGIRLQGFTPAGWRLAPLVAGTLSLAVLYLLARRLFGSSLAATVATGLLTFDFLHFVMSRTAMLDIFVLLFGLVAFLCLLYDRDRRVFDRDPLATPPSGLVSRLLGRPWLLGAGLAGGAAVASKWSGGYMLAGVIGLAVVYEVARRPGGLDRYRRLAREAGPVLLIALVLLPLTVYVVSYAGVLDGTLLSWPGAQGSWIRAFVERQQLMFRHHTGALFVHPYASAAWSWPLLKRPVLFYFRLIDGGRYQEILALGNPLIWWPALLALVAAAWRLVRGWRVDAPELVVLIGFAAGYLPWLLITRQEAFLYYLLPAVPFLCLALARMVAAIPNHGFRAIITGVVILASVAPFVFFRPLLVGRPMSYPEWEHRMWFRDCGPRPSHDAQRLPETQTVPPPAGWCWI